MLSIQHNNIFLFNNNINIIRQISHIDKIDESLELIDFVYEKSGSGILIDFIDEPGVLIDFVYEVWTGHIA